jgi:PKD domain/K319L-like, PKD domain
VENSSPSKQLVLSLTINRRLSLLEVIQCKEKKVPIMIRNLSKHGFNYSFLFWFILLTLNFLFFFVLDSSAATQVSLAWDPNSEPDLAGYRVFCREQSQSYDYANPSWEGTDTYCIIYDMDETKTYYFVVRAFDTKGFESGNSNEVYHEPLVASNQPPTADAGPDQTVNEGQAVFLNGSNSTDPDDGIASYHWAQIGEPTVNLSDPNIKQPTFTAPDMGPEGAALTFELTISDHNGLQGTDSCVVNITWLNEPPQANAGLDQTVNEGSVVTLDGSYSLDIDDGIESYSWNQISGPVVNLSNPGSCQPTFTAPNTELDGVSITFNLTVTDAGGLQNTDSCIVNITWQNEPPTVVVTPDYMETTEGTLVTLDGSASTDSDDGIASYLWSQVEGDPVSLSNPTSVVTTFTAPKTDPFGKSLKLKLTVKDFGGLQGTADSSIYVIQNELPTLNSVTISGSTQVNESSGEQYTLTANYSDGSSTNVTSSASWSENSGYSSISTSGYLTTSSVASDQSCSIMVSYEGQSDVHNITIKNVPTHTNNPPIVAFSVAISKKVASFADNSSDTDGDIVSWFWNFGDGKTSTKRNPIHRYVKFRTYSVSLTVTDNGGIKNATSKNITVMR